MTATPETRWDPLFAERSALFAACAPIAASWRDCLTFPDRGRCLAVLAANAVPVINAAGRAIEPSGAVVGAGAGDFERAVARSGALAVRHDNWHDLMNLLAWCVFPRTKAWLNAAHVNDLARSGDRVGGNVEARHWAQASDTAQAGQAAQAGPGSNLRGRFEPGPGVKRFEPGPGFERDPVPRRSALRDALTLFDENGVLVACADPALARLLREFRWRELFVEQRSAVMHSMRFVVVGHGLLDKARAPYIGLTGHACIIEASPAQLALEPLAMAHALDATLADALGTLRHGRDLAPLPLLGVPGWWPANETPDFYDNTRYFRPGRSR